MPGGGELKLAARPDSELYDLEGDLPTFADTVRNGLHARGAQLALHVPAADVVAMRRDATIGVWAAQSGVVAFDDQVLLVAAAAEADVRRVLETAAAAGWKVARSSLLSGWVTYLNVRITNPAAVEGILPGLREGVASAMRQDAPALPTLCHGLPVGSGLGRRHYLAGGEPDMLLPAGQHPRMVRAVLDGAEQEFRAAGFPVPLRMLGPLPAGRHELIADQTSLAVAIGIVLSAFVMSMFFVPALTALIGHLVWWPGHGDQRPAGGPDAAPEPASVASA